MRARSTLAALAVSAALGAVPALAGSGYPAKTTVTLQANGENPGVLFGTPRASGTAADLLISEQNQGAAIINNANANNAAVAARRPSQRNRLLADTGDVRIARLIGTSIYNTDDHKLGHVADVVMGKTGEPRVVVLIDGTSKKVAVPWSKLAFGDARLDSDNAVLMPGITKDALKGLPPWHDRASKGG